MSSARTVACSFALAALLASLLGEIEVQPEGAAVRLYVGRVPTLADWIEGRMRG